MADVRVDDAGWPALAAQGQVDGDGVLFRTEASGRQAVRVGVGNAVRLGAVLVEVIRIDTAISPSSPAPAFGDYDQEPEVNPQPGGGTAPRASGRPTFALAPDPEAPAPPPGRAPHGGIHATPPLPPPPPSWAPRPPPPAETMGWRARLAARLRARQSPSPAGPTPAPRTAPGGTSEPASPPQGGRSRAPAAAPARATPPRRELPARLRAANFGTQSFDQTLYDSLRRAPFFVLSAALHALTFLVFMLLLNTTDPVQEERGLGALNSALEDEEDDDYGETEEEVDVFDTMEDVLDLSEQEELESLLDEEATAPEEEPQDSADGFEIPDEAVTSSEFGVLPSADVFRQRAQRLPQPRREAQPDAKRKELVQEFNTGNAPKVNHRAAQVVRDMLGRGRRAAGATLDDIGEEDLLVVTGGFDKVGRVLKALNLPFRRVSPYDLRSEHAPDFSRCKVIFWNCGDALGKRDLPHVARDVREFVSGGGYLFTTDWSIAHILVHAFPGYLETSGKGRGLPEVVVDIQPSKEHRNHPLLEGVFMPGARGRWWLEQLAFDVRPGTKGRVEVLIESRALRNVWRTSPIVAATFNYGRGRVLHAMGHYFQEAGNLAGTIASHRLALNFVLHRVGQDGR